MKDLHRQHSQNNSFLFITCLFCFALARAWFCSTNQYSAGGAFEKMLLLFGGESRAVGGAARVYV